MKRMMMAAWVLMAVAGVAVGEEEKKPVAPAAPTSQPVKIDVTKIEAIEAAVDKDVTFSAAVESTRWTASGKTLLVTFAGAPSNFRVIGYGKNREELDKAFSGDIAGTLNGKTIEVTGHLKRYAGSVEHWKGMIEVAVLKAEQVKIVPGEKK